MTQSASQAAYFDDDIVRKFAVATMLWGMIGMSAGVFIASELAFPALNFAEWFNFGRFRPVHTNGVVLGFAGNALFTTAFYVVQRTSKVRLWGPRWLKEATFWGFQFFMVLAVFGFMIGVTQSKEYAEPEWYADIVLLLVWIGFFAIFSGTIVTRREPHIYVANWFFWAYIVTVAVLHIVNNISIPIYPFAAKSYNIFGGVQDALIQWWYGHNMVGFLLTAGFIGAMYYFLPKQAGRPIYSYRLSIVHFWALIFLYIWAGPHHLHYTALPDWTQTLGTVFSIMLWMPSWGGMINGIMTLSGAWGKLRTDPILRFMMVAVAFYGMATFEGPLMAIRQVNALSHFTDWTVGHVHSGALGWVGFMAFGAFYYMVPRLWNRRLYSMKLVEAHFWLASTGIILYVTAMWVAGVTQGLMWRAYNAQGFLEYSFSDTVAMLFPHYVTRAIGGGFYVIGLMLMAYNFWRTIRQPATAGLVSKAPALTAAE